MSSEQTIHTDHLPTQDKYEQYLVLAADMSTCDGETIRCYQLVATCARDEDEALETAAAALEALAGCVPLASFSAAELRRFADGLDARKLAQGRAHNLSLDMSDTAIAKEDAKTAAYYCDNPSSLSAETLFKRLDGLSSADHPEAF